MLLTRVYFKERHEFLGRIYKSIVAEEEIKNLDSLGSYLQKINYNDITRLFEVGSTLYISKDIQALYPTEYDGYVVPKGVYLVTKLPKNEYGTLEILKIATGRKTLKQAFKVRPVDLILDREIFDQLGHTWKC